MNIADHTFAEATFAITQIKIPHADKTLIKAKPKYLIMLLQETLAPTLQGLCIALTNIFQMFETKFLLRSRLRHHTDTWNKTTGENITLNVIHRI